MERSGADNPLDNLDRERQGSNGDGERRSERERDHGSDGESSDRPQGRGESSGRPQGRADSGADPAPLQNASDAGSRERDESDGDAERQTEDESGSRVSVVDEQPERPAPPQGADEEDYKYHTYKVYPSGRPDSVEFIDVYKGFGRAKILRGLSMGLPEGMVSMIIGPSGTGKSAFCTPTRATSSCTASRSRTCPTTSCSTCERSSACCSRTERCSDR
jgi:phospholipid/cholesterol/gamma-HCH transport system ATP-binding protein